MDIYLDNNRRNEKIEFTPKKQIRFDEVQILGKHSLTKKGISRNACVAYNKWEHWKTKIYTLQTQHAKFMVMVHCKSVGHKLPTNQVWNGYNGN